MHGRRSSVFRVLLAALVSASALALSAPALATNDTHWGRQWGPKAIGVEEAWRLGVLGDGVKIGIVDSGVELGHPDLAGKVVANAACIGTKGNPALCESGGGGNIDRYDTHGTHVAGIAAAYKDNGIGIAGVAPASQLVVARVFNGKTATIDDVNAGIKWVVDNGAKVVNLSVAELLPVGEFFRSDELSRGINYAWSRGAIPVLAAGNNNIGGLGSANYGSINALVVGATGTNDKAASYSSPTGDAKWAIMAPGGTGGTSGVYSTVPSASYDYMSGTSMAAPHVAGALALLLARDGDAARAVDTILRTAVNRTACSSNSPSCVGRLDVACAVGRCATPATTTGATTATSAPPDGGSGATQSGGTSGSGSSDTGDSEPAPTASSGDSGSSGSSASGAGGTAAAPGPSRATRQRSGLASRFGPPATEKPAAPSADPAGPVPGEAVTPEQVGIDMPSGSGEAEETPGRPLDAIEAARPSAVDERADPTLALAAAVLLLLVSFSALGLRRRQPE